MKTPLRSVAWLLPLVLAGCTHKTQQVQTQPLAPPIVDTPPPPPQTAPSSELPPPVVTAPAPQQNQPPSQTAQQPPKTAQKSPKHAARRPKPDTGQTTEQASNAATGASEQVSAIGQLTPGDSPDQRSQTERTIASIDQGLKAITRPLNDQEQKTATQIREFLKQARTALAAGDVDGAHTLAVKAKVLLDELNH